MYMYVYIYIYAQNVYIHMHIYIYIYIYNGAASPRRFKIQQLRSESLESRNRISSRPAHATSKVETQESGTPLRSEASETKRAPRFRNAGCSVLASPLLRAATSPPTAVIVDYSIICIYLSLYIYI